jgi:hypothetical protein
VSFIVSLNMCNYCTLPVSFVNADSRFLTFLFDRRHRRKTSTAGWLFFRHSEKNIEFLEKEEKKKKKKRHNCSVRHRKKSDHSESLYFISSASFEI